MSASTQKPGIEKADRTKLEGRPRSGFLAWADRAFDRAAAILTSVVATPDQEEEVLKSSKAVVAIIGLGLLMLCVGLTLKQLLPEKVPPPPSRPAGRRFGGLF